MKVAILYVLVALTVSITSSQPTHDLNQVSECGCEQELEALRESLKNQIALLNEKIDDRNNGQTAPSTVSPPPANG